MTWRWCTACLAFHDPQHCREQEEIALLERMWALPARYVRHAWAEEWWDLNEWNGEDA